MRFFIETAKSKFSPAQGIYMPDAGVWSPGNTRTLIRKRTRERKGRRKKSTFVNVCEYVSIWKRVCSTPWLHFLSELVEVKDESSQSIKNVLFH